MISKEAAELLSDEEIAALTLAAYTNMMQKDKMKNLYSKHGYEFAGDPNVNMYRLAELIADRGSFFNDDYADVLVQEGYEQGRLKDVFQNIVGGVKNVVGNVLPVAASIAGATGILPGGQMIGSLLSNAFGSPKSQPPAQGSQPQAPAPPPMAPQQAIQTIASETKGGTILRDSDDDKEKKDVILGMARKTFFWVLGITIFVVVMIIAIIIYMRNKKKNKKALPKN